MQDGAFRVVFDDGGMNLLSSAALRELAALVGTVGPESSLFVFESGRSPLFAAGADMQEMVGFGPSEAGRFAAQGQALFRAIERLPLPTVCLVDGDCFGGALDLALAFDLRLATGRSRFAHPGGRIGIVTGFGGTSRWKGVIAPGAARRVFLGNAVLDAAQAARAGLVDEVSDDLERSLAELREAAASVDRGLLLTLKELRGRDSLSVESRQLLARRCYDLYSRHDTH